MRHIYHLFLLLAFATICFSCTDQPVELNIMTFNVRYDNPEDSLNNWRYRKDVASEIIKIYDIDILGAQEVLVNQKNDLENRLPQYNVVGVGREDGKEKGEYSAVFYKQDRFSEVESGYFWLSETPEVAGSKGWDGACERIATWVILKEKASGKKLLFMNTHLDHVGKEARREGVTLLVNRAKELGKDLPVIITGDFNASPESDVIKHVTESGMFHDSKLVAKNIISESGTFHGFGRIPIERRGVIDYVFVTDAMDVVSYEVLPEKKNDVYISDHAPVVVQVIIP